MKNIIYLTFLSFFFFAVACDGGDAKTDSCSAEEEVTCSSKSEKKECSKSEKKECCEGAKETCRSSIE
jgi:hypothetical protein